MLLPSHRPPASPSSRATLRSHQERAKEITRSKAKRVVPEPLAARMGVEGGALCGGLIGAIVGIAAGPAGAVTGLIVGATAGAVTGTIMKRELERDRIHDADLDDIIGATKGDIRAGHKAVW